MLKRRGMQPIYFQIPNDSTIQREKQMRLIREIYENPHNNSAESSFDDSQGASPATFNQP
jgi:hypothetical protein